MGYLSLAHSFSGRAACWLGHIDCLSRDNSSGATPNASRKMKNPNRWIMKDRCHCPYLSPYPYPLSLPVSLSSLTKSHRLQSPVPYPHLLDKLAHVCHGARRKPLVFTVVVDVSADQLRIFFIETGCRRGQKLSLQWKGGDLSNRAITVFGSKTGERRTIPLTQRAFEILRDKKRLREKVRLIKEDPVFTHPIGQKTNVHTLRSAFEGAVYF